jgi:hypothetical protein
MLGLAFVLMIVPDHSQALAQNQRLAKATKADHEVVILGYGRSDQNCESVDPPALYLDKPPDHGTICFRVNDIKINEAIVGNLKHCVGRNIRGVAVVYLPRWKYIGPDHVRYTVVFPQARHSVYVDLTVLPDRSGSPSAAPADISTPAAESSQSPGPIPACTALVS